MSVMMTMGRNWSIYDLNGVWRCENGNISYSAFAPRPRVRGVWCGRAIVVTAHAEPENADATDKGE